MGYSPEGREELDTIESAEHPRTRGRGEATLV